MGEELERGRISEHELGRAADGGRAKREGFVYFQVSFFHGFVEYNLKKEKVRRLARLPISEEAQEHAAGAVPARLRPPRDLAERQRQAALRRRHDVRLRGDREPRRTSSARSSGGGEKPYWSTTSADGKRCYVSWSGTDRISIFSFRRRKEIARIKVGDHPQRIRTGFVRKGALAGQG